ncbi:MAG: S-methyl-5'-thioadenosine phosphorylase [Acidiferrobacteraceae bacterium]|nr:S-methyl-5'-thioadenosine phosphorylase [Acidiferrobacteraceae bacterium]
MNKIHPAPVLGIIGGSGIYEIDGLKNIEWRKVFSSFGNPSDQLLFGTLEDQAIVFLPRHGRGHHLNPSEINYRANIDSLKRSGVTDIISLSAVGSLREGLDPGTFVIVDQFIDRTYARQKSFFSDGIVAHVSMAQPTNIRLRDWCQQACTNANISVVSNGTYLVMEGPQFSTLAESNLYRKWGCDVIGMTNMPEAKLAREAEIPYCTVAMVTDYDCWHPEHENVEVSTIIKVLTENASKARALIKNVVPRMKERPLLCPSGDDRSLENAVITTNEMRNPDTLSKLDVIAGRVLNK